MGCHYREVDKDDASGALDLAGQAVANANARMDGINARLASTYATNATACQGR
jgi:hypothetical protein